MSVWLTILLLCAIFAGIGSVIGGVRAAVTMVGMAFGLLLAVPVSPYILGVLKFAAKLFFKKSTSKWLVALMSGADTVWTIVWGPVISFIVIGLVFFGVSFALHRMLDLHFKYKAEDYMHRVFTRFNKRMGIVLGLITGAIGCLVVAAWVYVTGYFTVQMASSNDPIHLKLFNTFRRDMVSSGLDKTASYFNFGSDEFYRVADTVALVFRNPQMRKRISLYPPYLKYRQNETVSGLVNDDQMKSMHTDQASLGEFLKHEDFRSFLATPLKDELLDVDLNDFQEYLRHGESPNFEVEKLLGLWRVDVGAVMRQAKLQNAGITSSELIKLKRLATTVLTGISLTVSPDHNVYLTMVEPTQDEITEEEAQAIAVNVAPSIPGYDPQMMQRYGMSPGGNMSPQDMQRYGLTPSTGATPGVPGNSSALPAATEPEKPAITAVEFGTGPGTWEAMQTGYRLKLRDKKGDLQTLEASVRRKKLELVINTAGLKLVLVKVRE